MSHSTLREKPFFDQFRDFQTLKISVAGYQPPKAAISNIPVDEQRAGLRVQGQLAAKVFQALASHADFGAGSGTVYRSIYVHHVYKEMSALRFAEAWFREKGYPLIPLGELKAVFAAFRERMVIHYWDEVLYALPNRPKDEAVIVGHKCTYEGRVPEDSKVDKIKTWGDCRDLTDVRAFLGTAGLMHNFIWNFASISKPLVDLTCKDVPFYWGPQQKVSQRLLKDAIITSPALRPLDYSSVAPIILCVDSSIIAIGYGLFQEHDEDTSLRYPSRFGSIALSNRESSYSQPKLELYGLYRALKAMQMYIIGAKNMVVEVDATAIKGMLNNPDMNPSATINRWVAGILLFTFQLIHVPGIKHGVDGLSRHRPFPEDSTEEPDDGEWLDHRYAFMLIIDSGDASRSEPSLLDTLNVAVASTPKYSYDSRNPNVDPNHVHELIRSPKIVEMDSRLSQVRTFLEDLSLPEGMSDMEHQALIKYASGFFVKDGLLWKRRPDNCHQTYVGPSTRIAVMKAAHDDLGHKGLFSVRFNILLRYWWPGLMEDLKWFLQTCHECQLRRTFKWHIPPVVAQPSTLFSKVYVDTFFMPR